MMTWYKPDSIRIASHQRSLPTDIGKFRPHTRQHDLSAFIGQDESWHASLPLGSTMGPFDTEAEAIEAGVEHLTFNGWTQDKRAADAGSVEHAGARRNNHPGRLK